ncbi:MAG: Brp/Blh family beta-carotene 15,15'-dioxygenase [Phycisphaera sp.]|nr:MAG: Brp/Blh family beta-carotene 15,15'-dioxygenase [Phycisphaera sp.]
MIQALTQPRVHTPAAASPSLRLSDASLGRGVLLYASCALTLWVVQGAVASGGLSTSVSTPGSVAGSALPGAWIWVVALFVVGMPHGAYDLAELARRSGSFRGTLMRFLLYTAVMLLSTMAFFAAPAFTLVAFLLLTMVHFGRSDSVHTRGAIGSGTTPTLLDRLPGYAHGAVVIAAPFLFQPVASWAPFVEMAAVLGADASLQAQAMSVAGGALVIAGLGVIVPAAVRLWQRGAHGAAVESVVIPAVALLASAVLPPLLAIGVYFMCVHAMLHCLRVGDRGDGPVRAVIRAHRLSVPLLLPSIVIIVALAVPFGELGWVPALAVSFILFCVFATLPHHLLWFGTRGRERAATYSNA